MAINYKSLPVYEQKQLILDCLENNQVVIVESPTGSGKTTQIPVILHEAGYSSNGIIGVTQPRRIAALSVSEFISKQLGTELPGLVGYKMRFEDETNAETRIKIMTDGILLQEMKLDPWLSKYSVLMIDEAHERSLNIDFVLGLVKRILRERKDFRVIVSSATMNTQIFSEYFDNAPIVSIDTITYPVTLVYDPISGGTTTTTDTGCDAILSKIRNTVQRVLDNGDEGSILIFLPGEKIIKDCLDNLARAPYGPLLHILPLYGRLAKEEQERVFDPAPEGKKKVVISTNIAETSVTISDVTTVIDCGLCKLNFYNPRTFTSSLIETTVSKASCTQRKGRAGRTQAGTCYRLYSRKDFETRPEYTTEEIYRTDLSEVVLRMAELGILDFYNFDFIANPGREGIIGAVDTLNMLGALAEDNTLSDIGKMMVYFPLEPRISRIIVEAIMRYPECIKNVLIAASFLSARSPFVLPPNQEMEARQAHHRFRDMHGDFCTYLNIFRAYEQSPDKLNFCHKNFLDERVMAEIENIDRQLTEIVSDKMGIPISEHLGNSSDYLCCIAAGMIQFVCARTNKDNYRTIKADHINIHPGSVMFRQNPLYMVAGEIVKTSRMFAMSVSPLTEPMLNKIHPDLLQALVNRRTTKNENKKQNKKALAQDYSKSSKKGKDKQKDENSKVKDAITISNTLFNYRKISGKKTLILPIGKFLNAIREEKDEHKINQLKDFRGRIITSDNGELLSGEKMTLILNVVKNIDINPIKEKSWNRSLNANIYEPTDKEQLLDNLHFLLHTAIAKQKGKAYGFIALYNDGNGNYWFKVSKGFTTALTETHASLEALVDENVNFTQDEKDKINSIYRTVSKLYEE